MLENIRNISNPYDFANPVSEENLFFGRSREITDVSYYLDQAKLSSKPIHIAFIGARASGKTSFLNITEKEAKKRKFCTVRINLNEGDVQSELAFYRKLFHTIVMAAFSEGAFGGKSSPTYFSYLEMISTGELKNIEQIPFITPTLMIRALKSHNDFFHVADDIFFDDLKMIHDEISKNIVILFDECNVLSANRIIIEKLRNIFMNLKGFMLILAATEDFFPVMDEVFSPIMRQFKKIDIGPFKDRSDVDNCIMHPLREAGFQFSEAKKLVNYAFVKDVDLLSGRRPYEIQLICHTVFRRCQEGLARRFALDLKTIENIQNEIASSQNSADRPNLRAARLLKRKTFSVLEMICAITDKCKLLELWKIEFLFYGESRWSYDDFQRTVTDLKESGLVREENCTLSFNGDDFDRLYIKYIARQKESTLRTDKMAYEQLVSRTLKDKFTETLNPGQMVVLTTSDYDSDVANSMEFILGESFTVDSIGILKMNPVFEGIFDISCYHGGGHSVQVHEFFISSASGSAQTWFTWRSPYASRHDKIIEKVVRELRDRSSLLGFEIRYQQWDIKTPTAENLVDKLNMLGSDNITFRLGRSLAEKITSLYLTDKNPELAIAFAELAYKLCKTRSLPQANNIGYLYMTIEHHNEAGLWFEAAATFDEDDEDIQLVHYNIGVVRAVIGDQPGAVKSFEEAIKTEIECSASCALQLYADGELLKYREIENPKSLKELSQDALLLLSAIRP